MPQYIPATDAGLKAWSINFSDLITANPTNYGEDAGSALVIQTANDSWVAAYDITQVPATRTPPAVQDKDNERVAFVEAARQMAMRINARDSVTDLQRADLAITVRKQTRTPIPAPATAPANTLLNQIPGVATIGIRDVATPTSKAKPFGVIGVDIHVNVGAVAVTDPTLVLLNKTTGKTPNTVAFNSGDAGQVATVFTRWTTRSGPGGTAQKGPWSVALDFVIM